MNGSKYGHLIEEAHEGLKQSLALDNFSYYAYCQCVGPSFCKGSSISYRGIARFSLRKFPIVLLMLFLLNIMLKLVINIRLCSNTFIKITGSSL